MNINIKECDNKELQNIIAWYGKFTIAETNGLTFNFDKYLFYQVKSDNELIGIMSFEEEAFALNDFKRFVKPGFRHKGIGESMLDKLIAYGRESGKKRIMGSLITTNTAGIEFLTSKGFTSIGTFEYSTLVKFEFKS